MFTKNFLMLMTVNMTWPVYAHQAVDVAEPPDRPKTEKKVIVEEESVSLTGDIGALTSDARKNWKAACDNWKRELREDNKGSKFPKIDCGEPTCSGDAGSKFCRSKATYKMTTKEEQ